MVVAAEAWPKPSPHPSTPSSVTMRSHTEFMVCQFSPPMTAGLPPMSNGIRVQYVSIADIFIVALPLMPLLSAARSARSSRAGGFA